MSSIYFSEFYEISVTEEDDWFDPRMVLDTKLCIDPFLVFKSNHSYFRDTKQKFLGFFNTAYSLASDPSNHSLLIQHTLPIGEVAELCLGFSETGIRGGGKDKRFAKDLIKLMQSSFFTPELFEALEIFTPGVGKDKISDAMANIVKRELIEYTLDVCKRHPKIRTKCFPIANVEFDYDTGHWDDQCFYLPINPYESRPTAIILVPKVFLRTIQSVSFDELSSYLIGKPNEELRALLNNVLGKSLKNDDNEILDKFRDKLKNKKTVSDLVIRKLELVTEFLNYVENPQKEEYFTSYNFDQDPDGLYVLPKAIYDFTSKNPLDLKASNESDAISCIERIIAQFQEFIERHDGYKLFWLEGHKGSSNIKRHRNESIVQNIFRDFVYSYCKDQEIKIETNINHLGENPVEFIFSGGRNKVLIKMKLYANIHLEKDELRNLFDDLKQSSVPSCYYLVFAYEKSEIEKMSERLKEVESVDTEGIRFKPIVINASIDRSETFNLPAEKSVSAEAQESTKVFISYSWDSETHRDRVLMLANTLRNSWGIEADIDRYVRAKPPYTPEQGWDLWMEKRIEWAEFVLIVCTEPYKRRFRGDEKPGVGRGVTWEGTIIRQSLYNDQLRNTKFIPVVFSSQDLLHIPIILNGNDKYVLEDEKSFRELCYRLRKEPIVAMPEVVSAKLQAPPEPKLFSPQKPSTEPPPVRLDVPEIQDLNATPKEQKSAEHPPLDTPRGDF